MIKNKCRNKKRVEVANVGIAGMVGPQGKVGTDFYSADGTVNVPVRTVDLNGFDLIFENNGGPGDVIIGGKLHVTGLIDPTGLIVSEFHSSAIPVPPNSGALYVSDGTDGEMKNFPIYKFANGSTVNLLLEGLQGPQGVIGSQGPPNISPAIGFQGSQGDVGGGGLQGVQGMAGIQSAIGTQGAQGIFGFQGIIAPTSIGFQGVQGLQNDENGFVGNQGAIGGQGTQGLIAENGTQGNQGMQGAQGVQGAQGNQGFEGLVGNQGAVGDRGIQGTQGNQGGMGVGGVGLQGRQGAEGFSLEGTQGLTGLQGEEGVATNGIQGLAGVQGIQGFNGLQGAQGAGSGGSGLPTVTQASSFILNRDSVAVAGFPNTIVLPDYQVHQITLTSAVGQNDFFTCPVGRRAILLGSVGRNAAAWQSTLYWKGTDLVYHALSQLVILGANSANRQYHSVFVLEAGEAYSLNITAAGVSILATMVTFDASDPISPRTARLVTSTTPQVLHTASPGKVTYGLSTALANSGQNIIMPTLVSQLYVQHPNFTGANLTVTVQITPFGDTAKLVNVQTMTTNNLVVTSTGWVMLPGDTITVSSSVNTAGQNSYCTYVEL